MNEESLKNFLEQDCDPDRHQNLINRFLGPCLTPPRISLKSVHNSLINLADRQTDRHMQNIISFLDVANAMLYYYDVGVEANNTEH